MHSGLVMKFPFEYELLFGHMCNVGLDILLQKHFKFHIMLQKYQIWKFYSSAILVKKYFWIWLNMRLNFEYEEGGFWHACRQCMTRYFVAWKFQIEYCIQYVNVRIMSTLCGQLSFGVVRRGQKWSKCFQFCTLFL